MKLEAFIEELVSSYASFADGDADAPSASFCLMLDHWERVRGQRGYGGLLVLLNQFEALVEEHLDVEVTVARLNERCIIGLLPHSSLRTANKQMNKLFKELAGSTFEVNGESLVVAVTLSWTEFDHRFMSGEKLLLDLVKSAERISAAGGNQISELHPDVSAEEASGSDRQMLGLLMELLRTDALKVLFQPILATRNEPSKSFQALPRLVSADGSLIPAASFVPAAREAGVLKVLDRWMISYCAGLLANEYQLLPIRLFLSQGDSLIQDAERREWLEGLTERNSSISGKLALDFSIDDVLGNINGSRTLFSLLDKLGIEICVSRVDEHSRWDLLVEDLPVDFVKMSPSFIKRLGEGDGLENAFRTASTPARERGVKIIMPMVEDASMAANLWHVGADYMQGFMIQDAQERIDLSD
jgi:EAL domain-containing protein (putative c-di-GMP-specific phosphodiesterase class I)